MFNFHKSQTIAIQMDPIEKLNFSSDSTLLIATELQARGYRIFYYTPLNLSYQNHSVLAQGHFVKLYDNPGYYFELEEPAILQLEKVELVLIRQNPPFDMNYLTTTYLLDRLNLKTLVLNNPREIRNNPEKLMIYNFPDFINNSIVSSNLKQLENFYLSCNDVIIKPLYDFGGNSVQRIKDHSTFNKLIGPYLAKHTTIIMQRFLPNVVKGDKRVLMVDGKIVGAILRIPQSGKITANLIAGGVAHKTNLTSKEVNACQAVGDFLHSKNLFLAGIDLLDGYLLEINITSPTAYKAYNKLYNEKIEKEIVDLLLQKVKNYC